MSAQEVTKRWILRWDVRDGGGRLHAPYGVLTSDSTWWATVAFDDNAGLGRRIWYVPTTWLKTTVLARMARGEPPVVAGEYKTGSGYLFDPRACVDVIDEPFVTGSRRDDDAYAVSLVIANMEHRDRRYGRQVLSCRRADVDEQLRGIDVVRLPHLIEVKSRRRHQNWNQFFVQIGETNPRADIGMETAP